MKKLFAPLIVLTIISISCTKVNNRNMTVVKDCTGSYLRFNGNDYHICNFGVVENYDNGTNVKASFKKINKCESNQTVCLMVHENKGWINVTKIE